MYILVLLFTIFTIAAILLSFITNSDEKKSPTIRTYSPPSGWPEDVYVPDYCSHGHTQCHKCGFYSS